MTLFWIKAIGLSLLVGSVALYVGNAEHNRGLVKGLEQENDTYVEAIADRDAQIYTCNERIKINNGRWLEQLQHEQERFAKAQAEADRIKTERDTITAELAASKREWQEAMNNDPVLAEFSRINVPGAVFVRMRHAAGQ